ncbi:iron chelate uptake ABC transporter family permease subunit [Rubritalea marina]|uniref:metal ABC transporter permease n=1 Tax=Rubritalea marina TaxID=361055 RepID=UPI00039F3CE0|nr:iron chelate uptake ABC transporter family permease subunit [Rubritalea marina]
MMNLELLATLSVTQSAILAAILVGLSCGLLGCYVVVRRVALVGDTLSHAVFPGVVAGFMWSEERNIYLIFLCAMLAGLLGVMMVRAVQATTRLKSDAALGVVLASFFGIGILWNSTNQQSGVKDFLFGDLAIISALDLQLMGWMTALVIFVVLLLMRPLQVISFDEGFAVGLGYPVKVLNFIFFALLTFTVVVALQAVGVVLVSAMLITPAATAYLLTDRMHRMMVYSAALGIFACVVGALLSSMVSAMPPGPVIALTATAGFSVVYFMAPRHGVVSKWMRSRQQTKKVSRENILKAIYKELETDGFQAHNVSIETLAVIRKVTMEDALQQAKSLVQAGQARWERDKAAIYLTPSGWRVAAMIVRNHRLWELYLTDLMNYESDHVHDDAEKIEHILGEDAVRRLERDLDFPEFDPHGMPIPSLKDFENSRLG